MRDLQDEYGKSDPQIGQPGQRQRYPYPLPTSAGIEPLNLWSNQVGFKRSLLDVDGLVSRMDMNMNSNRQGRGGALASLPQAKLLAKALAVNRWK